MVEDFSDDSDSDDKDEDDDLDDENKTYDKTLYFLDEESHQKFLQISLSYLKQIVFLQT
jgi:hypothetical protein